MIYLTNIKWHGNIIAKSIIFRFIFSIFGFRRNKGGFMWIFNHYAFSSIILVILLFFLLSACSHITQVNNDADSASRDAQRRLERSLSGAATQGGSAVPTAQVTRGGRQPSWVSDVNSSYNRERFIAAVGSASTRAQAESRALANLIAIFGQDINSTFTVATNYTEAVNRGVLTVSEDTNIRDQITTAASMDRLIGAEIGNVWDSGQGTVYVVAFMDKVKTISIYSDMIAANNKDIELLTTMSNSEKYSFDGYTRFKLAEFISGINSNFAVIITQAGGSVDRLNLRSAVYYDIEAKNIIRNITVAVDVSNDRANRVQDAFANVLNSEGLRTRGNNPVYTLKVDLNVSEVTFPGNNFIFCRIEASANLIENSTGASLLPFSFDDRSGHSTYANAETTAFLNVESLIAERYPVVLREYLSSLMP